MVIKRGISAKATYQKLPRIVRFLAGHMAFGLAVGTAFASALVMTNAGGLKDLIAGDGHPYLAMFVLHFMFALTFASVAMGVGVMTMHKSKTPETGSDKPSSGSDHSDK
ncbi:MAG: hypothetical protein ABL893_05970 [Hyphomicrobium sp.]